VLEGLLPAAWHRTDQYANNGIECDHGRLKARLRPMRGLKQDRSAKVIIAGRGATLPGWAGWHKVGEATGQPGQHLDGQRRTRAV
jgi:transposase-like protein